MAPRPIFCATHPRAVSTAFERVFMTRRDKMQCIHEPFGDAFYFGPESVSRRYEDDVAAREATGLSRSTYAGILNDILEQGQNEGKRVFIKDMAYYLMPPDSRRSYIAPSLGGGVEAGNPTLLPLDVLEKFHYTFLIRHPRRSIPSFYRTTIPPLREITGFDYFMPNEAGYVELVRLFDFLVNTGMVDRNRLTVIDADDMLDHPEEIIREYCRRTDIEFTPKMLEWNEEDQEHAEAHFAKWNGFHDDAIHSSALRQRTRAQKESTVESEDREWAEKYGPDAQKVIRATVEANIPYYEYLQQFCIKPQVDSA